MASFGGNPGVTGGEGAGLVCGLELPFCVLTFRLAAIGGLVACGGEVLRGVPLTGVDASTVMLGLGWSIARPEYASMLTFFFSTGFPINQKNRKKNNVQ